MIRHKTWLAATVFVAFSSTALAQEAVLSGSVSDSTGGLLPGVTVTAAHQATHSWR